MSTFYSDGFQDAVNSRGCLPPAPKRRYDGEETDCFGDEYRDGYADGLRQRGNDTLAKIIFGDKSTV